MMFASSSALPGAYSCLQECIVYYLKSASNPSHEGTIITLLVEGDDKTVHAMHPFSWDILQTGKLNPGLSKFRVYELGKFYVMVSRDYWDGRFRFVTDVVASWKDNIPAEVNIRKIRLMGISGVGLSCYTHGDAGWSLLPNVEGCLNVYHDIVYRSNEDKFYAVDASGNLRIVDSKLNSEIVSSRGRLGDGPKYLVESRGRLYLVAQQGDGRGNLANHADIASGNVDKEDTWFRVFRFDDAKRLWERVGDLGGCAFFVQRCKSFSVWVNDADGLSHMHKNCIYFSLQNGTYGIYNVVSRRELWYFQGSVDSPYIWPPLVNVA